MGREGGGWEPGKSQVPHLNADNSNTATMAVTLGNIWEPDRATPGDPV